MSAYICNPEHIAALAAWAAKNESVISPWKQSAGPYESAQECARELMRENIRSVSIRYPNEKSGSRPGPALDDETLVEVAAKLAEFYYFNPPPFSIVEVLKMASGYDYQACESSDWRDTLAFRQVQWIKNKAITLMPGYESAPWEYTDETVYARAGVTI